MQMFRKLARHEWRPVELVIGLWLLPLDELLQGAFRLPDWSRLVLSALIIPAAILYVVCSSRLANGHTLLKRELRGWGPFISLQRQKEQPELNEQDRSIRELAYQRAYAIILAISLLAAPLVAILSITSAHLLVTIANSGPMAGFTIVVGLAWLLWTLPITLMAWQIQKRDASKIL